MIRMFDFYIIKNILRIKNLNGLYQKLTLQQRYLITARRFRYRMMRRKKAPFSANYAENSACLIYDYLKITPIAPLVSQK